MSDSVAVAKCVRMMELLKISGGASNIDLLLSLILLEEF
jgi:hypothetical protein